MFFSLRWRCMCTLFAPLDNFFARLEQALLSYRLHAGFFQQLLDNILKVLHYINTKFFKTLGNEAETVTKDLNLSVFF